MSSEESAPAAPPPGDDDGDSRLHIRSIKELPSGHDPELATIFREMRRAAGVSQEQIAGRLATSVENISALETGNLAALPDWGELNRIITTYSAQLGLDARPILRRLESQMGVSKQAAPQSTPAAAQESPKPRPAARPPQAGQKGPPMPPSAAQPPQHPQTEPRSAGPQPDRDAQPAAPVTPPSPKQAPEAGTDATPAEHTEPKAKRGLLRFIRAVFNWAILFGFVGALALGVWFAAKNPRLVWSSLDSLPEPIPRIMRSAWELVRPLEKKKPAPPVTDPENRKSDKLP